MADDTPRLRIVDPDERAPAAPEAGDGPSTERTATPARPDHNPDDDRHPVAWMSAAVPLCIGIAILAVGLAISLKVLMGDSDEPAAESAPTVSVAPTSSIDPRVFIPTVATSSTSTPPTTSTPAPVTSAPAAVADPSLVPFAVGPDAAPPPAPTTGQVSVRIFNAFLPAGALDVWDLSGPEPVKYGTVGLGELKGIRAGGQLLPNGVSLHLRFVRAGGDPSAPTDKSTGPWEWNFVPSDGSSHTMVLRPNPGLGVVDIDDDRVRRDTPPGQVHVSPVTYHLVLGDTRSNRWAFDGVGCLGNTTNDNKEFDVAPGTALKVAARDDGSCDSTLATPVTLASPGAYVVVGMQTDDDHADLLALPLG